MHPRKDHPEWDTAVWVDVMTVPGTPHADDFYRDLERWMFRHFTGSTMVRTEWSKGWAYTGAGPYTDERFLRQTIPASHTAARADGHRFADAARQLRALDPHGIFTNSFIGRLLGG